MLLGACVKSVIWVMPQMIINGEALGVSTICLASLIALAGLLCIVYSFYFQSRIHGQGLVQLSYFSGPWIVRITYIFFVVWWCVGEVVRLTILRRNGRFLGGLSLIQQETVCKCYIVSNLGFSEPCLFLTFIFLLRASLKKSGTLSRKWNVKTAGFILLYCFPLFILQLIVVLLIPRYKREWATKLPSYFFNATKTENDGVALCTYPLLATAFLGLYAIVLTGCVFWLSRRILHLVINNGLHKRVCTLVFCISSFFPLRVLLLGLSVLSDKEVVIDALSFLAFLSLLCCAGVGICLLIYLPMADSLSLSSLQRDIEARRISDEYNDANSLFTKRSPFEDSLVSSPGATSKRGLISFRRTEIDEADFVELNLFNPSQHSSPPGSPRPLGWPMIHPGRN